MFGHNRPTLQTGQTGQTDRHDRQRSDSLGVTVLQKGVQKLNKIYQCIIMLQSRT